MPDNPPPAELGTHRDELPYFAGRKTELTALRKLLSRLCSTGDPCGGMSLIMGVQASARRIWASQSPKDAVTNANLAYATGTFCTKSVTGRPPLAVRYRNAMSAHPQVAGAPYASRSDIDCPQRSGLVVQRTPSPVSPMHTPKDERPTVGCLFGGMGGFASGMEAAGFRIAWATDQNSAACATLRHRFPAVRVLEKDVRQVTVSGDQLDAVDVVVAGFPCQSFSQAGDRRGFEDQRGEVFFEIPRLLKEFDVQPRIVILENVDYIMYGKDGWWFNHIENELRGAGYWFRRESCWRVNVKDLTDVPQDRRRVFMMAASQRYLRRNPFVDPPPECPRMRPIDEIIDRRTKSDDADYLSPDNRYYKMIDDKMKAGEPTRSVYQLRRSYVREKSNGLCPTLTANMGTGGHNVPFVRDKWGIRRLRIEEVAQLQGFERVDELFPLLQDNEKYRLLGNAVCPKLAEIVGDHCRSSLEQGRK